jgi:hypothetical protein
LYIVGLLYRIIYLINFRLFKNIELTNDHLEIGNLKNFFHLGPLYDATIDMNDFLASLNDPTNRCFEYFISNSIKNLILTTKLLEKFKISNLV